MLIITVITGVVGCSVNDAITLATSKNPKSTFRSIAKSSAESSVKKKVGSQSFNEMLALAKADDPNAFIGDKAKVF
ncbi:MAG: hypothetical protein OQK25_01835, partial [Gammaproteobacteria bacterium]|nr:hypothetical protein [Gammaproteobacteria bacterium]